jgi:hypothetical protein
MARSSGRVSVRSHGAEAQWQWEPHEGHTSWLLYVRWHWGGELDRGASRCPCGATRGTSAP